MTVIDENLCLSETVEFARKQISDARHTLDRAIAKHGWKDRIEHVSGLLTCGLVALAHSNEEIIKFEISAADRLRGPHLSFRPRGIGLDVCPCCFVCGVAERKINGNTCLNNIAAFVKCKGDGEAIVEWFGQRARVDFRESEPSWIQVKVGACDAHLDNLKALAKETGRYGVIRQKDIEEAVALSDTAS
jgi:hypothetical protein